MKTRKQYTLILIDAEVSKGETLPTLSYGRNDTKYVGYRPETVFNTKKEAKQYAWECFRDRKFLILPVYSFCNPYGIGDM